MRYCFDIDGTICTTNCHYKDAVPYQEVIDWINKKYDEKRAPLIEQRKKLYKTIKVETSNARKMKKINLSDAEKALLKNQSQLVTDLTKQRKEIINQITDLDLKETEEINNVGKDNTGQTGKGKKTKRNKNKHRKTKRRRTKRRRTKRTK